MSQTWRLIPFLEADGQIQMKVDRWLLQQHQRGNHPPTLRFYTWLPVAISLGYHQRQFPQAWETLRWDKQAIERVRRLTGGRAVLHQGDLCYTVVNSGLKGTRIQVYKEICQFLIQGWRSLGVELHYGQGGRGYIHNPNCFATATQADLVDQWGQKRIGSAQLKQGNTVLQQGSIVLYPDIDLFYQVFNVPPPLPLPIEIAVESLIPKLIEAASDCFEAEFQLKSLSDQEWQEIQQLPSLN